MSLEYYEQFACANHRYIMDCLLTSLNPTDFDLFSFILLSFSRIFYWLCKKISQYRSIVDHSLKKSFNRTSDSLNRYHMWVIRWNKRLRRNSVYLFSIDHGTIWGVSPPLSIKIVQLWRKYSSVTMIFYYYLIESCFCCHKVST